MKRRYQEDGDRMESNKNTTLSDVDTNSHETEEYKELLHLREEVRHLRHKNHEVKHDRMERETAIRLEVYTEMEARSEHLLHQINSLQQRLLNEQDRDDTSIVRKSAKKWRDTQKNLALQQTLEDLQEAEEELERVKSSAECQIMSLMTVKQHMESELQVYRNRQRKSTIKNATSIINSHQNDQKAVCSSDYDHNGHLWSPVQNSVSNRPTKYTSRRKDAILSSSHYEDFEEGSSPVRALKSKNRKSYRSPLVVVTNTNKPPTLAKNVVEM